MKEIFDKTFFKLAAGFAGILTIAIVSILVAGYYEMESGKNAAPAQEINIAK